VISIASIIAIILVLPIAAFSSWKLAGKLGSTKSQRVIDFVIICWIILFLLARILGLIYHSDSLVDVNWSLLPVSETNFGLEWLKSWPWLFFNFLDGRFAFIDFVSPVLLTDFLISMLNQANNRGKFSEVFKQYSTLVYIASVLPFVAVIVFNGHLSEQFQPPVWILLVLSLLVMGVGRLLTSDNRMFRLIAIALNAFPLIYVNVANTPNSLDYQGLSLLLVLIIVLEIILTVINFKTVKLKSAVISEQYAKSNDPRAMNRLKKLEEQNFYEIEN
jgi:hypothetical protein